MKKISFQNLKDDLTGYNYHAGMVDQISQYQVLLAAGENSWCDEVETYRNHTLLIMKMLKIPEALLSSLFLLLFFNGYETTTIYSE